MDDVRAVSTLDDLAAHPQPATGTSSISENDSHLPLDQLLSTVLNLVRARSGGEADSRSTRSQTNRLCEARRRAPRNGLEVGNGRHRHPRADRQTDSVNREEPASPRPYLYAEELSALTPWSTDAIDRMVARGILRLGVHYFQPGGRRIFKWQAIVELIEGERVGDPSAPAGEPRQGLRRGVLDVERTTEGFRRLLG